MTRDRGTTGQASATRQPPGNESAGGGRKTASETRPNNKPLHEVRLGRIKAAVWANTGESGVWYSVVFSRLYKEGDGWKRSESFGRDDLPLVAKIADQVHTWIYEQ